MPRLVSLLIQLQEIISKAHFQHLQSSSKKIIPNKDNLFKFKHVDSSSKSGTGYAQFYMNVFFWRDQHWALSNQHGRSLQLAIQCYKSNSIESINECIMIWSSILHKPFRTLFSRILTYTDLDPRPLDFFAWIEEALAIILQIASDNTNLTLMKFIKIADISLVQLCTLYRWFSKILHYGMPLLT